MSFQAPFSITEFARMKMLADQQKYDQQMKAVGDITGALTQLGGVVGKMDERSAEIGAMDKGVGLMSDIGAINPDIRDKFMNLKPDEKPFVFDLLRQSMFGPFSAGRTAAAQAEVWDQYRGSGGGGGMPGGARNQYGYFYQGP